MTWKQKRNAGFTLIELLIVVAIIGILASMLIPNMIEALQKAKQKRTLADMRLVGEGMMSWLTDQSSAAAAGAASTQVAMASYPPITRANLEALIVPQYVQIVPERDGWKSVYEYRLETDTSAEKIMAVRSGGQSGVFDTDLYDAGPFSPTDYQQDLVWTDGFFVRWPQNITN